MAEGEWFELRIQGTDGREIGRGDRVTSKRGEGTVLRIFGRPAPKVAVHIDHLGPHAAPAYFNCEEPEDFVYVCPDLELVTPTPQPADHQEGEPGHG